MATLRLSARGSAASITSSSVTPTKETYPFTRPERIQCCCCQCLESYEENRVRCLFIDRCCHAENQAAQNKQKIVSKAPLGSKEKAFTANLDDGGIGGGPGGGGGGFLFWGLLMLLGFVRDNEQDQPYRGRKLNKQALANRAKRRPQLQA